MNSVVRVVILVASILGCGMGLFAGGAPEAKYPQAATPPAWVLQAPPDGDGQSRFVAMGNDPGGNEGAAQDAAALDLISQINRYLGVTISAESTGTEIASANDYQASVIGVVRQGGGGQVAGLRIAGRFVQRDKQGSTVYLLGEYRTVDLEHEKAKRQAIQAENEAAIAVPEARGRESEARGELSAAIRSYLEAARAASDPQVRNGDTKLERNLQNALRVLARIQVNKQSGPKSIIVKQAFEQDFMVSVQDAETGQPLAGVDVVANFKEYQDNGRYSLVKRNLKTDSQGQARIRLADARLPGAEQLSFSLNLADAIQALAGVEGRNRDLISGLMNQAGSKKVVFDYQVLSAGRALPLVAFVQEIDENGKPTSGNAVNLGIQQRLTAAGFRLIGLSGTNGQLLGKSDAEMQALVRSMAAEQAERIAYGLANVLSLDDRGADGVFAKVNASISVVEAKTGTVLVSTTILVNGRGNNVEQARKDAFSRLGLELGDRLARDLP